eukprot:1158269-Pelagomonas_calceolata.AAC.5
MGECVTVFRAFEVRGQEGQSHNKAAARRGQNIGDKTVRSPGLQVLQKADPQLPLHLALTGMRLSGGSRQGAGLGTGLGGQG